MCNFLPKSLKCSLKQQIMEEEKMKKMALMMMKYLLIELNVGKEKLYSRIG